MTERITILVPMGTKQKIRERAKRAHKKCSISSWVRTAIKERFFHNDMNIKAAKKRRKTVK